MAVSATNPIRWEQDAPPGESVFELVDEHFPLLFIVLAGELHAHQVLELIRFVDGMRERAAAEQIELLTICDARGASRPGDLVRAMIIDWLRHDPAGPKASFGRFGSIIVTRNPIIRGVIASIKWATGHADQISVVASPSQALAQARARLLAAGLTPPAILAGTGEE